MVPQNQDEDLSVSTGAAEQGQGSGDGSDEEVYIDTSQARDFSIPLDVMAYEGVLEEKPVMFESKEKSTPCFKFTFTLTGAGLPPEKAQEVQGRKLSHNTPIAGPGAGLCLTVLDALGVSYKAEKTMEGGKEKIVGIRLKLGDALGKRAILHVSQRVYLDKNKLDEHGHPVKRIVNDIDSFSSVIPAQPAAAEGAGATA